jgi:hypothetical protein
VDAAKIALADDHSVQHFDEATRKQKTVASFQE